MLNAAKRLQNPEYFTAESNEATVVEGVVSEFPQVAQNLLLPLNSDPHDVQKGMSVLQENF